MTDFTSTPFTKQFQKDSADLRKRFAAEESCATCDEKARGGFVPPHNPSPWCESGKRPHCTCDVCF